MRWPTPVFDAWPWRSPAWQRTAPSCAGAGLEVVLLTVDEGGARVEELKHRDVGAMVLTPNRQHPTGALLVPRRRSVLLEWARSTGAFVIEDDYDGEFRYDGHPVGPLQGLDPNAV